MTSRLIAFGNKLAAASVVSFVLVIMALSFSSAIVGGDEVLAKHEAAFISMSLLSLVTGMIVHLSCSTVSFITAGPYTSLSPLLAAVATALSRQCAEDEWLPTTIVCFSLMTLVSGCLLYLLAHPRVRLGRAAAFLPAPVLMGMLIAIAFTLIISALQVATGVIVFQTSPLGPMILHPLPTDAAVLRRASVQAACAILMGGSLFSCRFFPRPTAILLTPSILLAAIVLFRLCVAALGVPEAQLREEHWLSRKLRLDSPLDAFASITELVRGLLENRVDWSRLFDLRTSPLQALPVFCVVDLLLVLGTLPVLTMMPPAHERGLVDADRELATAGLSSMVQGLLGVPGAAYFIGTSMQHRDLHGDRSSGWIIVGLCALCTMLGPLIASSVPRFVLGGLFINFAASYLVSATALRMTPSELVVLAFTAVGYVCLGAMAGLLLGLVFTCLHFVLEQSQLEPESLVESVERAKGSGSASGSPGPADSRAKQQIVITLKNTLFFATTHHLTAEILRNVDSHGKHSTGCVTLNFARVQSVDLSAIHTLSQLSEELKARGWDLASAGLRSRLAARFKLVGLVVLPAPPPLVLSAPPPRADRGSSEEPAQLQPQPQPQPQGALASALAGAQPPEPGAPLAPVPAKRHSAEALLLGAHHEDARPRGELRLPPDLRASESLPLCACSAASDASPGASQLPPKPVRNSLYGHIPNDSVENLAASFSGGASHSHPPQPQPQHRGLSDSPARSLYSAIPNDSSENLGLLSRPTVPALPAFRSPSEAVPGEAPPRRGARPLESQQSFVGPLPVFQSSHRAQAQQQRAQLQGLPQHSAQQPLVSIGEAAREGSSPRGSGEADAASPSLPSPAQPLLSVPENLGQLFGELFRSLAPVEYVAAGSLILSSDDVAVADEMVWIEAGDALLWRALKANDAATSSASASLKSSGAIVGGAEVLLRMPRRFEARMLTEGRIVRVSTDHLMQIRQRRPDAWELILLKALQGQTSTVNEVLFSA